MGPASHLRAAVLAVVVSATALVALAAAPAAADDATIDPGFVNPQVNGGIVLDILRQADGKLLVAGSFTSVGGQTRRMVARLNPNGTLDPTFQDPGVIGDQVNQVMVLPSGKILIAGAFGQVGGQPRDGVARLRPNGTLDPAFVDPNLNTGAVNAVVRQPSGRLVIAGTFSAVDDVPRGRVARLHPNGTHDTTFTNPQVDNAVRAIVRQPDGRLVIGGFFNSVGGAARNRVARLTANGALDPTFIDPAVSSVVHDVLLLPNGKIVIAGEFTSIGFAVFRDRVARLQPNGGPDTSFVDPDFGTTVDTIVRMPDGRLLAGGQFGGFDDHSSGVSRLHRNGARDAAFGEAAVLGNVRDVVVLPSGRVLIGGGFTTVGGQPRANLARLTGAACDGRAVTVDLAAGHATTAGNDVVRGRPVADNIVAKGGHDRVCALGGRDTVRGKAGKDRIFGGGGDDRLIGGDARDRLAGGPGADRLEGGPKKDTCLGGPGADTALSCEVRSGIP